LKHLKSSDFFSILTSLYLPYKEGDPRFPTEEWVNKVAEVANSSGGKMTLAAHLCGKRCMEILDGDDTFVSTLFDRGFRRVQVNATARNAVDISQGNTLEYVQSLWSVISKHPELEFIIQRNQETKPLYEGLLTNRSQKRGPAGVLLSNITMLVDESKGTGIRGKDWPNPPQEYDIGYAGGIGPDNLQSILKEVIVAGNGRPIWIDMETSVRSIKNGNDIFDLEKCYKCIEIICESELYSHPPFLCHN